MDILIFVVGSVVFIAALLILIVKGGSDA